MLLCNKNEQVKKILGSVLLLAVIVALGAGCEDRKDKAMEGETQRVARSAEEICPILIGANVPELTLRTVDGKLFDLNEAIRNKPTVLIFYRGGWCPYCNTHLGQIATVETELLSMGYQVLAVSPDRPEELRKTVDGREHRKGSQVDGVANIEKGATVN